MPPPRVDSSVEVAVAESWLLAGGRWPQPRGREVWVTGAPHAIRAVTAWAGDGAAG